MSKLKIFIIDDDDLCLFLTQTLLELEEAALEVRSFLNAKSALQALEDDDFIHLPDVILLDLNMPVMSGWEFLDALAGYGSRIPASCNVYILSSSVAPTDERRAKEYPIVSGYFQKPIESESIKRILQTH
ncbi:response regulator [Pontibacter sp. MBLB2868]|uniref:response regulator n=1 Tax=Pontibacter sp. MBLB2868 TaxID=3451555 RepID=UPI003F750BCE